MLRGFLKFTDTTSWLAETLAVLLLYGFCGVMLAEVFSRSFLNTSLPMSWEYSAFAMAAVFLLGAGPALRHGTHVRVTLLQGMMGVQGRRWLDIAATLMALMLACLLLAAFWSYFADAWTKGLRQSSHTNTPLIYPLGVALLGAAQFVLDLMARVLRLVQNQPAEFPLPKESRDA